MGYQHADNKEDRKEWGSLPQEQLLTWVHRSPVTRNFVTEGTSRWHPVDGVRDIFEELRKGGIYLRRGEAISGPFALNLAQQRIDSADKRFTHMRYGISGPWMELTDEPRWANLPEEGSAQENKKPCIGLPSRKSRRGRPASLRHVPNQAALPSSSHPSPSRRRQHLANTRFWEFRHASWEPFPGTAHWVFLAAASAIIFLVGLRFGVPS